MSWVQQTGSPYNEVWQSIASSSDGTKLVAVSNAGTKSICTSTNSGVTWTKTSAPPATWSSVASSSDGTKLVAVINATAGTNTGIWRSSDSGATWTQSTGPYAAPHAEWSSVASSSDGTKLVAVINATTTGTNVGIWRSNDSGVTWTKSTGTNSAPAAYWSSVASSEDGTKLVAVSNYIGIKVIYTSTNSGVTWTKTSAPPATWSSVASSSDGTKLVAVINATAGTNVGIWRSNNSGDTWTKSEGTDAAPAAYWTSVASSSDGKNLVAVIYNTSGTSGIYTSNNYGATWAKTSAPAASWKSVVLISDVINGTKIVAVSNTVNGSTGIFTSSDSGVTWTNQPSANSAQWRGIVSSSDGKKQFLISERSIYKTNDSGVTWTKTSAPIANWNKVSSSSDGTKLVAGINNTTQGINSGIYTSSDSGVTWTKSTDTKAAPAATWRGLASSSDGTKLVAVISDTNTTNSTGIWRSDDSGATWTKSEGTNAAPAANWYNVASSSDGKNLVAVIYNTNTSYPNGIWRSNDSGVTWRKSEGTNAAPAANWRSVASSEDGTKLVAVISDTNTTNSTGIWRSDDSGATWTKSEGTNAAPAANWRSVASSYDGKYLVAVINSLTGTNAGIWRSSDYGVNWTKQTSAPAETWCSVASSYYGEKIVAIVIDGISVWTYTDPSIQIPPEGTQTPPVTTENNPICVMQ
jgi:hypothetical protein